MKKAFMIVLATCLVVFMVGTALADHTYDFPTPEGGTGGLTVGWKGHVRGRITQYDLTGDTDPAQYWQAFTRMLFAYTMNDFKAVSHFEIGWLDFDSGNEDAVAVEVKHLYITGPIGPGTFSGGLQNIKLGNGIVHNDDDFAFTYGLPVGPGQLVLAFVKEAEGDTTADDDVTVYAVIYAGSFGGFAVSPFFAYGDFMEDAGDGGLYWLGLPVSGALGPVSLDAEFDYLGGSLGDLDYSAFAFWANASMDLGMATVYGEVVYGTGDDDMTDTDAKEFMGVSEDFGYDIIYEDNIDGGLGNLLAFAAGADAAFDGFKVGGKVIFQNLIEGDDTALGTEINVKGSYKLTPNFVLSALYGVLLPGDALGGDDSENLYKGEVKGEFTF